MEDQKDVPDFLKIQQMLASYQAPKQDSAGPAAPFAQMPSPLDRGPVSDSAPPTTRAPSAPLPKPVEASDDSSPDDVVAPDGDAKSFQKTTSLDDLRVTKDDLDKAAHQKKMALAMGMIGQALANKQSAGNFYLGRMNPQNDIQGFGQKMAGLADQPIQDKQLLLKQAMAAPGQDLTMRSSDSSSPESQLMSSMMKTTIQNNDQLDDDQKSQMLKMVDGKNAMELNQIAGQPIFKDLREDNKLFQSLNNKVEMANAKNDMMRSMMANNNGFKQQRIDMMGDKAAAQAGKDFEDNPIIKSSKGSLNSIHRSLGILDNTEKPVTTYDLNLAYNDYINAVANGGAATEGKIKREMPETFEGDWNTLKQKAGVSDDLRKTRTGAALIDMLKKNMAKVQTDLGSAISDQAKNTASSYGATTNQKVKDTVAKKLDTYTQPSGGGGEAAFSKDVLDYAKQHGITPQQAQSIKEQRGGK